MNRQEQRSRQREALLIKLLLGLVIVFGILLHKHLSN